MFSTVPPKAVYMDVYVAPIYIDISQQSAILITLISLLLICPPSVENECCGHSPSPSRLRLGLGRELTCAGLLQVAAEYFKNTTLLLVGVICVAAAVEKWNLHKRIALRMVMIAGAKPGM